MQLPILGPVDIPEIGGARFGKHAPENVPRGARARRHLPKPDRIHVDEPRRLPATLSDTYVRGMNVTNICVYVRIEQNACLTLGCLLLGQAWRAGQLLYDQSWPTEQNTRM